MTEVAPNIQDDPIYIAAAEWLLRLQNPQVSLEETLEWQSWVQQDPRHARAFESLEEVSLAAKRLVPRFGVPRARRVSARLPWAIAASVVLVSVSGVVWLLAASANSPATATLATSVGENRTVSLKDGSKVTLGGDTRMEVSLTRQVRTIDLAHGEAFFVVAKDNTRPFKVHAGDATVIAVGTEFNVRRGSDRSVVSVVEGRVLVEPTTRFVPAVFLREFKPKLRPVHVDAGEQTMAGSAGIEDATKVADPSAATSWQSGRLSFRLQPLRYVLEDVNRYAAKPIVLEDDSIGSLVITGTVTRSNVAGWVQSLEQGFGLVATDEPNRITLRRQ